MIESQHEYICEGCEKLATVQDSVVYRCTIYPIIPSHFIKKCLCPFNKPKAAAKKKITKGQQKQGRNR